MIPALTVSDIILAIVVTVVNPQISIIYQFDIRYMFFFGSQYTSFSSYLFVGVNLDRAVAIKKPFFASKQGTKTILLKILICFKASFVPSVPYLFNQTIIECKMRHPGKSCWPPTDNELNLLIKKMLK